jgi:hypothetical protein
MYYDATSAKLFMGQSTAETLPDPSADTYDEVLLTGSLTPPSYALTTAFFNVTNDKERRSIGGKLGDQSIEGNFVIDWDDDIHNKIYADASTVGGVKRNWYLEYAGGRRLDFRGFVSNFAEESLEASDEAKEHRATVTCDGGITATPAP